MRIRLGLKGSLFTVSFFIPTLFTYSAENERPAYYSVPCVGVDSKPGAAPSTYLFPALDFESKTNDQGHLKISATAMTFSSIRIPNPNCSQRAYHEWLVRADAGMQAYPTMPQRRDTALGGLAGGGGGGGRRDTSYGDLHAYYENGNLVFSESSDYNREPEDHAPVIDDRRVRVKGVLSRDWNAYKVYPSEERKELTCTVDSKIVALATVQEAHAYLAEKMVLLKEDEGHGTKIAASIGSVTHPECIELAENSGDLLSPK